MKCVGSDKNWPEYEIGRGRNAYGQQFWIGYFVCDTIPEPKIYVQRNADIRQPHPFLPPKHMLEFQERHYSEKIIDGKLKFTERIEPPGWFERKCKEANCEWFVPMVKRMAAGENVPLEEIQAAYLKHNGQPMPCGEWSKLFR